MAELNLGFLRHQTDNQRLNKAGFGAELKTRHSAAIRAGQGLLLSADLRTNATSHQLDAREAIAQLEQSHALQQSLTDTAQKHHAKLKHENQPNEPAPDKLPAILQQQHSLEVLKATTTGNASPNQTSTSDATPNSETPSGGGAGQVPAWSEPQLQLTSPAGITASTPQNILLSAGNTANLTASHDLNLAAQGNHHHLVKNGISLFTYGKSENNQKPNTETGIKLHTATGKVSVQSQSDKTTITADKAITVASTTKTITIAAPQHLLMTAQGAYLKLEGGNIMIHGPGAMQFKASMKELGGPGSMPSDLPVLPVAGQLKNFIELNYRWDDLQPMVGAPYKVLFNDGTSLSGKLDAKGHVRLENTPAQGAVVTYGEDERKAVLRHPIKPNPLLGAKANTEEAAQAILAQYVAQEDAHLKDNYFPDEIEDMLQNVPADGSVSQLDYDFHYNDYRYKDEDSPEDRLAEKSYRERHDNEGGEA